MVKCRDRGLFAVRMLAIAALGQAIGEGVAVPVPAARPCSAKPLALHAPTCTPALVTYQIRDAQLRLAPYESSDAFYFFALFSDVMMRWPRASWRQPTVPDLTEPPEPWVIAVDSCESEGTIVRLDRGGVHNWDGERLVFPDGHQIVAQKGRQSDLETFFAAVGASALNTRQGGFVLHARLGPDVKGTRTLELGLSFESALAVYAPEFATVYDAQLQRGLESFSLDADHDGHVSLQEVLDNKILRDMYRHVPASFDDAPAGPSPPSPDLANDRFSLFVRMRAVSVPQQTFASGEILPRARAVMRP